MIIPTIVAVVVFMIYMMIITAAGRKDSVRERVKRLGTGELGEFTEPVSSELGLVHDEEKTGLASALEPLLRGMGINIDKYQRRHQLRFYRAGFMSPSAPILFLGAKWIGMPLALGIAVLMATSDASGTMKILNYFAAFILVVLGVFGPDLYISNSLQKRHKKLTRSFPDALDLLLVCVESGLALDGALSRVCKELDRAHPEVTEELNRTRLELTLLNDRERALQNLAERTDLVPFRSLVATLLQTEKFGTSLTDTLRVLSEDYRTHRLLSAEEKAGRLPVLMTIPLITLMMPAFFLIVMGPAILNVIAVFSDK